MVEESTNAALALIGLDRVALLPVQQNDRDGYTVTGEVVPLPEATKITRGDSGSATDFFSDDKLFLRVYPDTGTEVSIPFNSMGFGTMVALGFGTFDETTGEFTPIPGGVGKQFALTYRQRQPGNGRYRMFKHYVFTPSKVAVDDGQTMSNSTAITTYTVTGVVTKRDYDGNSYVVKDSEVEADCVWLDGVPAVGSAA